VVNWRCLLLLNLLLIIRTIIIIWLFVGALPLPVLYSVIISLNIIRRGAATITALFVLWSTPSSSSGSLAAALLLLTEPRMHVLPCLLVFLKSGFVVLSLGLRLELAILMSPHTLLPCIQRNGTHKVVLEAYWWEHAYDVQ
jgi:hypothetical protein